MRAFRQPITWLKEHPFAADALLGGFVFAFTLLVLCTGGTQAAQDEYRSPDAVSVGLLALCGGALAWRCGGHPGSRARGREPERGGPGSGLLRHLHVGVRPGGPVRGVAPVAAQIDPLLNLVYALLGLAVLIALLGAINVA